jgi:UPF0755 protein
MEPYSRDKVYAIVWAFLYFVHCYNSAMRSSKILIISGIILLLAVILGYYSFLSAPQKEAKEGRFVVPLGATQGDVIQKLVDEGFIKSIWAFNLIAPNIEFGGYRLSKDMNAFKVASALENPYMKWIVIPEGLRKEEVAEKMRETHGWSEEQVNTFITVDTKSADTIEGIYFPDTYLIPLDESTSDVAKRMNRRFNEVFEPYAKQALEQDIKWITAIKIASLVQREAAGKSDMPLIAGVIWNRLEKDMKLDIDATLQYARGDAGNGWWAPLTAEDKKLDSPYNTYIHKGLPPYPIANPGLDAIRAVLNPEDTDCFYYLHEKSGEIHCAVTFDEHKENIEKYLR